MSNALQDPVAGGDEVADPEGEERRAEELPGPNIMVRYYEEILQQAAAAAHAGVPPAALGGMLMRMGSGMRQHAVMHIVHARGTATALDVAEALRIFVNEAHALLEDMRTLGLLCEAGADAHHRALYSLATPGNEEHSDDAHD